MKISKEMLILPLKGMVMFPSILVPLTLINEEHITAINDVLEKDRIIGLFTYKDDNTNEIYEVGTAVLIIKMFRTPDDEIKIYVQGIERIKLVEIISDNNYKIAKVEILETEEIKDYEKVEALTKTALNKFETIVSFFPNFPDELIAALHNVGDADKVVNVIASNLKLKLQEKQDLLEENNLERRLEKLNYILSRELEVYEMGNEIQNKVKNELDKSRREYYLREQLKAIKRELGEDESSSKDVEELRYKVENSKMSEEAKEAAMKELDRMENMNPSFAEYSLIRTYVDWLLSLPWQVETQDNLSIIDAEKVLNSAHYGLDKVKDRILEFLAVRKNKKDMKGPILCLVGPPGVGKTSLGKAIAESLNRKFVRMALGGLHDEAEIRGHRRTYVGAMPGRIMQEIKRAGSMNPVFMLDEIDKVGKDFKGDPTSALLEVLDPEQNNTFNDNYLDVKFDLSKVMFITTANNLSTIPSPLLDRMEVLELPGYIDEEKYEIANRFLVARQNEAHGLDKNEIKFTRGAILDIILNYTSEAGVRNLEREIANVIRKIVKDKSMGKETPKLITKKHLEKYLGKTHIHSEMKIREDSVGVATGMAWTMAGGKILFVEASLFFGKENLFLTGSLGDIMKESATIALNYIKSNYDKFMINNEVWKNKDIHIHVPSGAVPKDGPSAGITLATAIYSLFTNKKIKKDIAMTGEITLRGKVLPIGGVKEKLIGAYRAGIREVILPADNKNDIDDIPTRIREKMKINFVKEIDEVFAKVTY